MQIQNDSEDSEWSPLVKEVGRMTRINKYTKQGVAEIPTGYNNPDQPKMREPFLVDSFDQAQQMQEDELAENLIQLIDDFNIVWAKLDKIMNSTSTLFKIQKNLSAQMNGWRFNERFQKQKSWIVELCIKWKLVLRNIGVIPKSKVQITWLKV